MVAGSLPPPCTGEVYRLLIEHAERNGALSALDADGPVVRELLDRGGRPTLLKMNSSEFGRIYGDLINTAMSDIPADMTITMHLCRGNFRSTWMAQGGYERVADVLFNRMNADAYFMEYDTDRAGDFSPLRHVPKGKHVILGLISTKTPVLESKDVVKRRIDEAAKYLPLEQLALSAACGFGGSPDAVHMLMTEDDQWRKIEVMRKVVDEVWR